MRRRVIPVGAFRRLLLRSLARPRAQSKNAFSRQSAPSATFARARPRSRIRSWHYGRSGGGGRPWTAKGGCVARSQGSVCFIIGLRFHRSSPKTRGGLPRESIDGPRSRFGAKGKDFYSSICLRRADELARRMRIAWLYSLVHCTPSPIVARCVSHQSANHRARGDDSLR